MVAKAAFTRQTNVGQFLFGARIETSASCRQQFANMLLCRSHTLIWVSQHELANISLTCKGHLTPAYTDPVGGRENSFH